MKWIVISIFSVSILRGYTIYLAEILTSKGNYQISEWLISYQAGFIRRGLSGELLHYLLPAGLNGLLILSLLQFVFTLIPQVVTLLWLEKNRYSYYASALALNPAFVTFVGWDSGVFGRKEWILFCALSLVVLIRLKKVSPLTSGALVCIASLLFLIAILTWEPAFLAFPFFVWLIRDTNNGMSRKFSQVILGLLSLFGTMAFVLSIIFHGSPSTSKDLCEYSQSLSLGYQYICNDAIYWLSKSTSETLALVFRTLPENLVYVPLALLAWLPLFSLISRRNISWHFLLLLPLFALFIVGLDYGRWINVVVTCSTFLVMAKGSVHNQPLGIWNFKSVLLFSTLWSLPHAAHDDRIANLNLGLLGLVLRGIS